MTVNQLFEVILGKSCCFAGLLGDATPFLNKDINEYFDLLKSFGYNKYGDEIMYSGITGDQIKTDIFIGPTYYQRLKIMVEDKIHSRSTGPINHITRQPAGGKSNDGGFRIGEMERDAVLAHGMSEFLKESITKRSDGFFENKMYTLKINEKTGLISDNDDDNDVCNIEIPYATKLFLQEIESMSIAPRLIVENTIYNKPVFNHLLNNINDKFTSFEDIDEEEEEEEDE